MGQDKLPSAVAPSPPLLACCLAEVLGTFFLVFFGCGAVHVAVLLGELQGLWQVGVVWGVAIMVALYTVGGISGAHINPAITLALTVWGRFPAARAPAYIVAQLVGAFLGAWVLFGIFAVQLSLKEDDKHVVRGQPGSEITAMCYGEYFPNPGSWAGDAGPYSPNRREQRHATVTELAACLAEVLGTAILALVVLAVTDPKNRTGPGHLAPVFIGLTVAILIVVIAPITQACFNPARDFGPRLFAYLAGWGPIALPDPRGTGFFTVYILSPILGAITGMGIYRIVLQPYLPTTQQPET
jgi:glycerol uptake facilitator protein